MIESAPGTVEPPRQFPWAQSPVGSAPLRRRGSIRRTSTIDTDWPEGYGQSMRMRGTARDVWTPPEGGDPVILAEDLYTIIASPRREILSIQVSPDRPQVQQLVGSRAGGESRALLARLLAGEQIAGTPLYLILDDFAGASLVAGWVWSLWIDDWSAVSEQNGARKAAGRGGDMAGVCTGFSPGSSALGSDGASAVQQQSSTRVPSLVNPADPLGWHELGVQHGVGMRRARRIDVWAEDGGWRLDVGFQDSGTDPNGGDRVAVHEYQVTARAIDGVLSELECDARILPYRECPGAVVHAQRMLGMPLAGMRTAVLETLPGVLGCTHLNDVLRSMAEVPMLMRRMP